MIYFVQQGKSGPIKIGYTDETSVHDSLRNRLRGLQVGNPKTLVCLATMEGSENEEEALQSKFTSALIRGEWFRPVFELLCFIGEHGTPFVDKPSNPYEASVNLGWAEGLRKAFAKGVSA